MKRWRPKRPIYYFLYHNTAEYFRFGLGIASQVYTIDEEFDKYNIDIGNCFRTKKQAESMCKKILAILKRG